MNRLTRRTSFQFKPPLRGRMAAEASDEQKKNYSMPVIRERPSIPRRSEPKNYRIEIKDKDTDKVVLSPFSNYVLMLIVFIILFLFIGELFLF